MKRNGAILCLAIVTVLMVSAIAVQAQATKPADTDVKVTVEHQSSGWPLSPLWTAVGAIGLVALIALVVSVSRGRGSAPATTIVKG